MKLGPVMIAHLIKPTLPMVERCGALGRASD